MAWCFDDEKSDRADRLLDALTQGGVGHVPSHWPLEVTNVLLTASKKGRIASSKAFSFVSHLMVLPIACDTETGRHAFTRTFQLAQASGLTSYDAAYLELAIRTGHPLASNDEALCRAAADHGVVIL